MELFRKKALLLVVFITGACVLVLEVVAVRILSPYFGNTIYSYSSILGVVLAALSLGYYYGGKYADKYPTYKHFFSIILLSGFSVIVIELLILFVLPSVAYNLPFTTGPLILSIILFGFPSLLLGTLSPYGVKLHELNNPKDGVGKLSGEVFFVSTVGSIVGSLLTGFVLIPRFGIQNIVIGVSVVLLTLGAFGLFQSNSINKKVLSLLFFSLVLSIFAKSVDGSMLPGVVHVEDGVYERLMVYDTVIRGKDSRMLLQDRSSASAIDKETGKLVFEYAQYSQLHKLLDNPKEMLVIGAGTYTMPKVLLEETKDATIDVVEIEPKLYELAKNYYGLKESPRLHNYIADGRRFLYDSNKKYDFIFGDAYASIYAVPTHLVTKEFFELTKSKLQENGLFVVNVIGTTKDEKGSLILSFLKTFQEVFPNTYLFAAEDPNSIENQNFLFVAYNSDKELDLTSQKIVDSVTGLPIQLDKQRVDTSKLNLDNQIIFTDNYVPAELFGIKLLKKETREISAFDGDRAYQFVRKQLEFGPRYAGSEGHAKLQEYIINESKKRGYEVVEQPFQHKSSKGTFNLKNIVVRYKPEKTERILIGAHYDTKRFANLDKKDKKAPVIGANDGGSGTAVLLGLMTTLKERQIDPSVGIDFVFFDGEEAEDIKDGFWEALGSTYFARNSSSLYPQVKPKQGIIVDMVCDSDLKIYKETNSDRYAKQINSEFFELANKKYPEAFSTSLKHSIGDDHIPLNQTGIPTILLIDFDYPSWHTTEDTLDKCSDESLEKVGESVLDYLLTTKN